MKSKLKNVIFFAAILTLIAAWGGYFYQKNQLNRDFESFVKSYDSFDRHEKAWTSPLVYKVYKKGEPLGHLVFESEVGYQSEVVIATLVSPSTKILDVRTFRHNETPPFYNRLVDQDFFSQFRGRDIAPGVKVNNNIDAITGATISANAATRAAQRGMTFIGDQYLNIEVKDLYADINFGEMEVAAIVMILLATGAYRTNNKNLRTLVLIYSVLVMGFHFSLFISYSYFFTLLTGNWPSFAEDLKRYLLIGGLFGFIAISGKNVYCAYMCPFGALQELQHKFAKLPTLQVSANIRKAAAYIPPVLAFAAMVSALTSGKSAATSYEPFSLIFGGAGVDVQWILLPLTLLMAFFSMRFYCFFGCPIGYILKLTLRFRAKVRKR
jgi:hypothetical protein